MTLSVIPTSCDGCGACCMEQAGFPASWYVAPGGPMGSTASGDPLPHEVERELRGCVAVWLKIGFPVGPCIWFDQETRKCRHYEHRPSLCRDGVKVGDEACMNWRGK